MNLLAISVTSVLQPIKTALRGPVGSSDLWLGTLMASEWVIQESISLRILRRTQIESQFQHTRSHAKRYFFGLETGNDNRLNQRGSYLSLKYINIIHKIHILTKRTNWLSPLTQIHNRATRHSADQSGRDLTNFRAYVGTLSASELGD